MQKHVPLLPTAPALQDCWPKGQVAVPIPAGNVKQPVCLVANPDGASVALAWQDVLTREAGTQVYEVELEPVGGGWAAGGDGESGSSASLTPRRQLCHLHAPLTLTRHLSGLPHGLDSGGGGSSSGDVITGGGGLQRYGSGSWHQAVSGGGQLQRTISSGAVLQRSAGSGGSGAFKYSQPPRHGAPLPPPPMPPAPTCFCGSPAAAGSLCAACHSATTDGSSSDPTDAAGAVGGRRDASVQTTSLGRHSSLGGHSLASPPGQAWMTAAYFAFH